MTKTVPAAITLTEQQEAFAVAFATNGGNATEAAREAGYSERTARQQGSRLARQPHVQQRIARECAVLVATNVPMALKAQRELLTRGRSDMVKHLVAVDMLDRSLGKATGRIEHDISGELTVTIDLR
jgi:phage terminase small subunit